MVENKVQGGSPLSRGPGDGPRQGRHHRQAPDGAEDAVPRRGRRRGARTDDRRAEELVRAESRQVPAAAARSFRHLYFSPDRRGARANEDAASALAKLAGQPEDAKLAASLADPFMFQEYYRDRAPEFLGKEFGPRFALAVAKLPPGSWQGPVESGFGWHLVFVDTLVPGRVPPFEEIEGDVKTAWLSEQKATAWEKAYKDMRAKYTVLLPAPPDAQTAARIAATPRTEGNPDLVGRRPAMTTLAARCLRALCSPPWDSCRSRRSRTRRDRRTWRSRRPRPASSPCSGGHPCWPACGCRSCCRCRTPSGT